MEGQSSRQGGGLHYGWIIAIMSVVTVLGALVLVRFACTTILPSIEGGMSLTDRQALDLAAANMIGYLRDGGHLWLSGFALRALA